MQNPSKWAYFVTCCCVLGGWLFVSAVPLHSQSPQTAPASSEEAKWKQEVQTVWSELTQARKRRFGIPAAEVSLSSSEIKKLNENLKLLEAKLDRLAQEGGMKAFQVVLTEEIPLPEVTFPGVPKGEGILGGVQVGENPSPPTKFEHSEGVTRGNPVIKVMPAYPELAKKARVSGDVPVEVVISKTGKVIQARCLGGHPLFQKPALSAASQWRFQPTVMLFPANSTPVNVKGMLTLKFAL
ncbi:MAG: energy transducer TonB [Blastocatellia bacterium]|nr:energy transducer TonB [Blastocatellia bacterium]